jgi:biotin carboxylase
LKRLLLLCPTRTYRAEAFVHAARRLDIELSIASEEPSALSHLVPDALPFFDFDRREAATAFTAEFGDRYGFDAVVPVDDQATLTAAWIAEAAGLDGSPPDAVYATMNKYETRRRMRAAGMDTPAYHLAPIDDGADALPALPSGALDYPVVVKPLMLAASRGVIRANNAGELADAFTRTAAIARAVDTPADAQAREHILVEEFVPGWEVAVEGLVTDGRLQVLAIFDKPDPLEGPYFPETFYVTPSRLDRHTRERIVATTRDAVTAMGLTHGPVHAELRGDEERAVLIEIAARSIGGLCSKVLRFEGGLGLEDVILLHAMGAMSEAPPLEAGGSGVLMMQAPREGVFEEMRGVDAARATRGIDEVIVSAHPGRRVLPLPEGFLYVGFVFARAADPDAAETALREAASHLDVIVGDTPAG